MFRESETCGYRASGVPQGISVIDNEKMYPVTPQGWETIRIRGLITITRLVKAFKCGNQGRYVGVDGSN